MKKLITGLVTIAISLSAMAEVPSLINYQGKLKSKFGGNINDTPNFLLKVFDQRTGGKLLYEEEIGQVSVVDGAYSLNFGENGISKIPTIELMAVADGEKQIFNYTTRTKPVVGNIKISGGGYSWTDAGSSDSSKFTATINKTTGSVSAIYITEAPKAGAEIKIEYNKRGITEALLSSSQSWLELTIEEQTLSPRERLVTVPFALKAKRADIADKLNKKIKVPIYSKLLYMWMNQLSRKPAGEDFPKLLAVSGWKKETPQQVDNYEIIYIPEGLEGIEVRVDLIGKSGVYVDSTVGFFYDVDNKPVKVDNAPIGFRLKDVTYAPTSTNGGSNFYYIKNPPTGFNKISFYGKRGYIESSNSHTIDCYFNFSVLGIH